MDGTSCPTRDQSLSKLMMGWKYWFFLMLKCLIPTCKPEMNSSMPCTCQMDALTIQITHSMHQTRTKASEHLPVCTHLSEVPRMVLVHHDSVVMLTTSISASSWMLPVLADTAMSSTDVTTLLPVLPETCMTT